MNGIIRNFFFGSLFTFYRVFWSFSLYASAVYGDKKISNFWFIMNLQLIWFSIRCLQSFSHRSPKVSVWKVDHIFQAIFRTAIIWIGLVFNGWIVCWARLYICVCDLVNGIKGNIKTKMVPSIFRIENDSTKVFDLKETIDFPRGTTHFYRIVRCALALT